MEATFNALTPAQESCLLTLYLRALDCRSGSPILGDTISADIADKIDHDFARQEAGASTGLVLDLAVRTKRLDELIRAFVAQHPNAVVIDLGCGLDPRVLRCQIPATIDWYDIDYPAVVDIREQFLPQTSHTIGADLNSSQWMNSIPADRPTMIVADGLMAYLSNEAFKGMTRALTTHFAHGEFATNAYTRFVLKIAPLSSTWKAMHAKPAGEGIDDPHEAESWGARLTLIEDILLARSPDVAKYPQPLRSFTRLSAYSTRFSRMGSRVIHYRFS